MPQHALFVPEDTPIPVIAETRGLSTEAIVSIGFGIVTTLVPICVFIWKHYGSRRRHRSTFNQIHRLESLSDCTMLGTAAEDGSGSAALTDGMDMDIAIVRIHLPVSLNLGFSTI